MSEKTGGVTKTSRRAKRFERGDEKKGLALKGGKKRFQSRTSKR